MVCKKCGGNVPEDAGFCTSCGSPVSQKNEKLNDDQFAKSSASAVPANSAAQKRKIHKKLVVISALCIILLAGGIGVYSAYQHYNSPRQVMNRSIDNNIFLTGRDYGSSDGSCEFYVGGKYSGISGTVAPQSSFSQNSALNFEIYADGVIKYSAKVTQKTLAFDFEADISGAEWIEIRTSPIINYSKYYADTIIFNPVLFKQ